MSSAVPSPSLALLAGLLAAACAGPAGPGPGEAQPQGAPPATEPGAPAAEPGENAAAPAEPGPRDGAGAPETPGAPAAEPFALPAEWRTLDVRRFEAAALRWLPAERVTPLAPETLATLVEALAVGRAADADAVEAAAAGDAAAGEATAATATAVRAAVLLARSRDPRAGAALLARLEERAPAPERAADAADVVAAAALAGWRCAPDVAARLERLACGPQPHPDLEVRVECARSALAMGRDGVIDFLLAVLRAETADRDPAREDWPPTQRLAWAKSRAAEALAARAGVPCTFQPDGSYADQARAAAQLEARLAEPRSAGSERGGAGEERGGAGDDTR